MSFGITHWPNIGIQNVKNDHIYRLVHKGWVAVGAVRCELTFYHCEAKEMQLFDSQKLCHTVENILPCGLWLEQVKRQRKTSPFYPEPVWHSQNAKVLTLGNEGRYRRSDVNTYPDSDVQLVFVG